MLDISAVPFVALVGLQRDPAGRLMLPASADYANHLGIVHASAQFTLAENASGEGLLQAFPDLVEQVVAVVREGRVKFRQATQGPLIAHVEISEEDCSKLREQFAAKGRAFITVAVVLREDKGRVTCEASFDWFVQRRPPT